MLVKEEVAPQRTAVDLAIRAEGLVKVFGSTRALDRLDLSVPTGSVFALLGPNGAGKTTAVRILTTLLKPDGGSAWVAGHDVVRDSDRLKSSIGLCGQSAAVDEYLTGRENLDMIGRLYHLSRRDARQRASELLEEFDLGSAADRPTKTYSGGMRRRLDLAAALVVLPPVLFLDEPTTGLDPRGRRQMWDVIRSLVAQGTTLLLTTQYLEEADELANRIAVMDSGRIIAEGSADELKRQVGGDRVEVKVAAADALPETARLVAHHVIGDPAVDRIGRIVSGPVTDGTQAVVGIVRDLDQAGISISDLQLRRPSLDDVFLTLTGHAAEEKNGEAPRKRFWRRG